MYYVYTFFGTPVYYKTPCINITYNPYMFQPSKSHPKGVRLVHFSSEVNKMNHHM